MDLKIQKLEFKRGDTFNPLIRVTEDNSEPVNISNWTIISQVRDIRDNLISTLNVSNRVDSSGEFNLGTLDTSSWPVGELFWDIQYINAEGVKISTETIVIRCIKDISRS